MEKRLRIPVRQSAVLTACKRKQRHATILRWMIVSGSDREVNERHLQISTTSNHSCSAKALDIRTNVAGPRCRKMPNLKI
jgi:hypothetical protein